MGTEHTINERYRDDLSYRDIEERGGKNFQQVDSPGDNYSAADAEIGCVLSPRSQSGM